jgi:hypothetical protein
MPRALLPLSVLLLVAATGCSKVREISTCRAIVREVNGALDEVESLSKQKPANEARIAKRYGDLAKALVPHAQGEAPLAVAVRDYVSLLQSVESAVKSHEAAAKAPSGRAAETRRDLDRLVKRERGATSRIEAECHN